jgi:hypothetical protein
VAVGHKEETVSMVSGSNGACSERTPRSIVPEGGKVIEDDFEPSFEEDLDVLNEDELRLNFLDNSGVLLPES